MKRPTGQEFVDKAREYIGTPWMHAQRVKGVGVDCVGLFICVARELGLTTWNAPNYSRYFRPEDLYRDIDRFYDPVGCDGWIEGDLLVFQFRPGLPQHVGMFSWLDKKPSVIHAYQSVGRVVEHELTSTWRRRVCRVYRWKEEEWQL